ncbi:MAG TPA: VIT domain-containing protein [Allosphingosinicella sp.]|nr:VIT domain-containing protein [Allosphingosinicella sp.]
MNHPLDAAFVLRAAFVLLFAIAFGGRAPAAEPANPSLTALVGGVKDKANRRDSMRIAELDVAVRVHGGIADTIVTARLLNSGTETLEADFGLALPAGSTVTGYSLDIEGKMLAGVLLDQRQARQAYEAVVRRGVDPGLAEVLRGFQFRNRVSPVLPGRFRTIQVSFSTPLDPKGGYVLPLSGQTEIGKLDISVEVSGVSGEPAVALPDGGAAQRSGGPGLYRYSYSRQGARLERALVVAGIERSAPVSVSRHPNGEKFIELSDSAPAPGPAEARRPRSVAVLWDRSLSRGDDALKAEAALLRAYLERVRPERTEIVFFDSGGAERVRLDGPDDVARALLDVRYLGGSSLAVLAGERIEADACLLFTDGLVTVDRRDYFRPDCPVFPVSTAADADRAWLGAVAAKSGGEALHLDEANGAQVLERLLGAAPRVLDVRTAAGAALDFTLLDAPENGWRLVAPAPAEGGIVVRLAGPGGATDRVYALPAGDVPELSGAGALWASERLALRAASDETDRGSLVAFARRYSVAGPEISFLVLELAADYARGEIEPPAGFPQEKRKEYDRLVAEKRTEEQRRQAARFDTVLASWEKQKAWWSRRFDPNARPKPRTQGRAGASAPDIVPPPSPMVETLPPPPAEVANAADVAYEPSQEAITVTGSRTRRPNLEAPNPARMIAGDVLNDLPQLRSTQANSAKARGIEVAKWAADRPYLKALDAARPADRDRVLAAQQAEHGALPAFWLDVSDYYFRAGRRPEALRLLLSALDLPTRDSETSAIVAGRLVRWGDLDRAIQLYERLAASEADRPQPLRSLALALAKRAESGAGEQARADLARAIALLTQVAMKPWDDAYDGIELISLMEVNRLIPRYRRLGGGDVPLDPRLVALLDVDLRVVIEWNTEATDLDLWVDEANGERAIYSNPLTIVGGHLSNDMTQGYGPEEYLLRRAPRGIFTVKANVYASDRLNPNGGSRITAHLIRDFGRANEREEVVDLEVLPGDRAGERLIGRMRVPN